MSSVTKHRGRGKEPTTRTYPFDEKCLDLARYFYPNAPTDVLLRLAEEFQVAAEDYASEAEPASSEPQTAEPK